VGETRHHLCETEEDHKECGDSYASGPVPLHKDHRKLYLTRRERGLAKSSHFFDETQSAAESASGQTLSFVNVRVMSGFLDSGLKLHVAALRFWADFVAEVGDDGRWCLTGIS
jgi:hypothetical protein